MLEKLKQTFKKKNLNQNNTDKQVTKKKIDKKQLLSIIAVSFLALAHIAIIALIVLTFQYYAIYPEVFGSAVAIVVCLLIIIDIIFFVGFNHQDLALKIISLSLSVLILITSCVGSYVIGKVNGMVSGIFTGEDKYETYSGVFVSYKEHYSSLKDLDKKKVGLLEESEEGLSYIAKGLLSENKVDYIDKTYKTNAELVQALIDGSVDAIVITSAYRSIYQNDENSNFKNYLEDFNDFNQFEKDLKVKTTKAKKDLTKEPFNVLLIGYSRTDIGSSVGLADSIILATINPQTYTVSMMSIARDSFVPISCYGGAYDKINSGRSTSRACFIDTVEDFIGMDIDYYMEADYLAIVYMVNALGGVPIDNPVDFELDGTFVPAGQYVANGDQALQFCRERHHMPNGDFDRQKHQKEVIIEIAKKLIQSGDASRGLTIMNGISKWFSTDFTFQELSTVFNLLLKTKNYTNLDTFDLVDFQTLRITGEGGLLYYSYSMRLPLWVYLVYQGSYDESMEHIQDVMGKYYSINQEYSFKFSARAPYVRPNFYSLDYESRYLFTPEPMPPYWADLSGMTYAEALAWASENGVELSVISITPGDPSYDPELEGLIVDQEVRYGALISEYSSSTITIMGSGEIDESKQVPSFVKKSYEKVLQWTRDYGVTRNTTFQINKEMAGLVISQTPRVGTDINECRENGGVSVVVGIEEFDANSLKGKTTAQIKEWASANLYYEPEYVYVDSDVVGTDEVTSIAFDTSDNSKLFTFSEDVVITISKYRPEHTITVVGGTGSGTYKEGEEITISAVPEGTNIFDKWDDGDTNQTRTITVEEDKTYTATFATVVESDAPCDASAACSGYDESQTDGTWACTKTTYSNSTSTCACAFTPNAPVDPPTNPVDDPPTNPVEDPPAGD